MLDYKGLTEEEVQELIDTEIKVKNKLRETWIQMNEHYNEWLLREARIAQGYS